MIAMPSSDFLPRHFLPLDRRKFLGAVTAGVLLAESVEAQTTVFPMETKRGDMLYRSFGKTGETVSVLGIGGSHIGQAESDAPATKIIRTAVDRGVNFMDNSWDYKTATAKQKRAWARRCATVTGRGYSS